MEHWARQVSLKHLFGLQLQPSKLFKIMILCRSWQFDTKLFARNEEECCLWNELFVCDLAPPPHPRGVQQREFYNTNLNRGSLLFSARIVPEPSQYRYRLQTGSNPAFSIKVKTL